MSPEQVEVLRRWHEASHAALRAMLPADVSFMGLQLQITEDVFPIDESVEGDPYHQAVAKEVGPGLRVLDMGTGCGVSALLAAQTGSEVVATDVNPKAVECARANAERNGLAAQITFVHGDLFQGVEGDFDLIIFDPPFRWFEPRDILERSHADAEYRTLTRFMVEAPRRLRTGGRIVMNFGTSGDFEYLRELIDHSGLSVHITRYGEATKFGFTAEYYVIRLSKPSANPDEPGAPSSDPFHVWRSRREAEGPPVTLIDLYRLVAEPRGLAPHELPLDERTALRDRALPVMWPGYQAPAGSERAERDPIEIVPYDSAWPARFQSWRDRLATALGAIAERIEHVGSTAVPGLAAKPVIDIQVSVADPELESSYAPMVEGLGVQLRSRDHLHRFFRPFSGLPREVQVHVCATGSAWERRHLLFRDYLRSDGSARDKYLTAKLETAQQWRDDRVAYADAKTEVINRIMDQAETWAIATGWRP
jgi:release factor glutamine methyltransferase